MILAYFIFGFYLAIFELTIYETGTEPQKHPLFHDYRGVSHVVTSHSKGSLSPSTILLSADKANLSFLFFYRPESDGTPLRADRIPWGCV